VNHARRLLATHGAKLIQALLTPAELHRAPSLIRNGFQSLGTTHTLEHTLEDIPGLETRSNYTYRTFSQASRDEFLQAIEASYEGSQDFPELDRLRAMEDVLTGYQAVGQFTPEHWKLIFQDGGELGAVLLVNPADSPREFELVYLGVLPAFRGRGLGTQLTHDLLTRLAQLGLPGKVRLGVDARNQPALRMYDRLGFRLVESHQLLLMPIDPADQL
jgi:ribosomal protein S18 acetylase RimI-like enzyme